MNLLPDSAAELSLIYETDASGTVVKCLFLPLWTRRMYSAFWWAGAATVGVVVFVIALAERSSFAWLCLLIVGGAAAVAFAYLQSERRVSDGDERFLLNFVESALEAERIDRGAA
jgi:hypothetical protein